MGEVKGRSRGERDQIYNSLCVFWPVVWRFSLSYSCLGPIWKYCCNILSRDRPPEQNLFYVFLEHLYLHSQVLYYSANSLRNCFLIGLKFTKYG